jgi:hypothetical protein
LPEYRLISPGKGIDTGNAEHLPTERGFLKKYAPASRETTVHVKTVIRAELGADLVIHILMVPDKRGRRLELEEAKSGRRSTFRGFFEDDVIQSHIFRSGERTDI